MEKADQSKEMSDTVSKYAVQLASQIMQSRMLKETAERKVFTIADLGCADGVNSLKVIKAVVSTVTEIDPSTFIEVYLNDIQEFSLNYAISLFTRSFAKHTNVFIHSIHRSFYEPLFPSKTIDLIFSMACLHWLSRVPEDCAGLQYFSVEGELLDKWEIEAERHLKEFLKCRREELAFDGKLIISSVCINDSVSSNDKVTIANYTEYKKALCLSLKTIAPIPLPVYITRPITYKKILKDSGWIILNSVVNTVPFPVFENYQIHPEVCQKRFSQIFECLTSEYFHKMLKNAKKALKTFYEQELPKAIAKSYKTTGLQYEFTYYLFTLSHL